MNTVETKTILSAYTNKNDWFGDNYNINLYRGCCHGCIYCDSRSECYHVEDFDTVRVKKDALKILQNELKSKRKTGVVGIGAMSDSYNPFEKKLNVTRGAMELLAEYGFGVGFSTKSDLFRRDIDVMKDIKKQAPATAKVTITTMDDELCKLVEPYTAPASKRLEALAEVSDAGITTGVLMMPLLPFIQDTIENVVQIVEGAKKAGAKFVFAGFGVTLRQNQRIYYYEQLNKHFPGLMEKYNTLYGEQYSCTSPNSEALWKAFADACERNGLVYHMKDIIELTFKEHSYEQMTLF